MPRKAKKAKAQYSRGHQVYYEAGLWMGSRKIEWVWGWEVGIPHPDPVRGWIIRFERPDPDAITLHLGKLNELAIFEYERVVESHTIKIDPTTLATPDGKYWIGDPYRPQQVPLMYHIKMPTPFSTTPRPLTQ